MLPFGAISCHMSLFFAIEASSLGLKASLVFFCIGASDIGVYWWIYIHGYGSIIRVHVVPVSVSFGCLSMIWLGLVDGFLHGISSGPFCKFSFCCRDPFFKCFWLIVLKHAGIEEFLLEA